MAVLEALRPELKHRSAGRTLIRDVHVDIREDASGDEALYVVLVLADPPIADDGWPVDDLRALRRLVREEIGRHFPDLGLPWFVAFEPEHPDLDPDEPQQELDLEV